MNTRGIKALMMLIKTASAFIIRVTKTRKNTTTTTTNKLLLLIFLLNPSSRHSFQTRMPHSSAINDQCLLVINAVRGGKLEWAVIYLFTCSHHCHAICQCVFPHWEMVIRRRGRSFEKLLDCAISDILYLINPKENL